MIIQADWLSQAQSHTVVSLPLTAQVRTQAEPLRVTLSARDLLRRDRWVIMEQPCTLNRRCIGEGPLTARY